MGLLKSAIARLHRGTTIACSDYEGPYVCNAPRGRPITRLFIALLMLILIITAVIILYHTKASTSTERHFGTKYLDEIYSYHEGALQNQNLSNLVCSCRNTALRWTNFTNFYIMKKDTNVFHVQPITVDTVNELCKSMNWTTKEACGTLLQFCCGLESFTVLETMLLLHPHVFSSVLGRSLQNVCTNQERYYHLLLQIIEGGKVDKPRMEILSRSLFAMADAYVRDPNNESDEYYWEAPLEIYQGVDTMSTNRSIAFKMVVSWVNYMHACDPLYCDEVRQVSKGSRMLQSLAEVGGFSAVLLLLVRGLVWPLLMYLCSWKHADPLETMYSLQLSKQRTSSSSLHRSFSMN